MTISSSTVTALPAFNAFSHCPLLCALTLLACLAMASTASAAGVDHSGRWFTYDGQPTYLVGLDAQELACNPAVNYVSALNLMTTYRINKVRLWAYCYWNPSGYLHPYTFSNGKFNLDQWNPSYWTRVRDFVAQARARKIVVEMCVFAAYPKWWTGTTNNAFNQAMNVNGAFTTTAGFSPQYFDLNYAATSTSGKRVRDYQQALVDKTVAELGAFDNVYFEIMNEFGADGTNTDTWHPWALHWAQRIKSLSTRMVAAHAGSPTAGNDGTTGLFRPQHYWDRTYIDVMNFRFFSPDNSPQGVSNWLNSSQHKGKVLCVNESNNGTVSYVNDLDGQTRYSWGLLLNGAHMGIYVDDSLLIGNAAWLAMAKRLKAIRDVADKVNFSEMSPVDASRIEYDGLVTQGPSGGNRQVLAKPGSQYLVYFWGSQSTANTLIQLPAGTYAYEWYDARDAALRGSGTVNGGGTASIPAPATSGWSSSVGLALVVRVTAVAPPNAPPTVSITSPANGSLFTAPANITVSANASDSNGTISKVDFLRNGVVIGTDSTSPYSLVMSSLAAGSYSLTARDSDNGGSITTSGAVSITVTTQNTLPPTLVPPTITAPANNAVLSGTSATISWNAVSGAASYLIRCQDLTGTTPFDSRNTWNGGPFLYIDRYVGTSITATVVPGHSYQFWIHSAKSNFSSADSTTWSSTSSGVAFSSMLGTTNTPPSVSITSPANGSSFTAPANVTVNANASDSNGTVSKVDFYRNGVLIGTDTTGPYSLVMSSLAAGSYSLTAKATDDAGAATTSGAVGITVNGSTPAQSPFNGTAWAIPGNVAVVQYDNGGEGVAYHDNEAANFWSSTFRPGQGVDSDGVSIGWIGAGEWLEYTVNVSAAGAHTVSIPVSNTGTGGKIHLEMNGINVTGSLTVPNTGSWTTFQNISAAVNLSAGTQVMRIAIESNSSTGGATNLRNSIAFTRTTTGPVQTPYTGVAWAIPGNIAVVQYDNGGEGVAYHDNEAANFWSSTFRPGQGVDSDGVSIGWMGAGEWLEYTVNVSNAGSYTLTIPVSNTGTGGKIHVSMNGVDVTGLLTVPTTGSWNTYQNLSKTVNLNAGAQVMRISIDSNSSTGGATNLRNNVVFSSVPIGTG